MKFKIKPWAHQLEALNRTQNKNHYALFFEQGCGKTFALINILRQKYIESGGLLSTIIFCPPIVVGNWEREILAFSDIEKDMICCLTGSQRNRVATFEREREQYGKIFITNYESLLMVGLFEGFKQWKPQCIVLDESHKCKDLKAKRTKNVIKLSLKADYKFILSGTPIVNSPFDIYSQFLFMDGGETFNSNFVKFRREYFRDLNANRPRQSYFPNWVPKTGSLEAINKKIYTKAMRVKKAECLDLPPLVKQIVEFKMTSDQARTYRDMERDCITYFNNTVISADLAIKKAMKLHQITNNFIIDDNASTQTFPKNERIATLKEVMSSIPKTEKIIIWCVFKQNYKDITRFLTSEREMYVELHGAVPSNKRQANIDSFNLKNSPYRVMVAHPGAGGIGINLTQASYAIFYSHGFSLENDMQAEARNHRGGSEIHTKITRIDIVAKNTIDEIVVTALRDKKDISEQILKHMKGKK